MSGGKSHVWIDLGNSPHIPFFLAIARELKQEGSEIVWTARDYAQTVQLAKAAGLEPKVVGTHGGGSMAAKGKKFLTRTIELLAWARRQRFDIVLSHNSQEPLVVARLLGLQSVNMMDYEHHPANHLSFRMARNVFVPEAFPDSALQLFGAGGGKAWKYPGIKEDVYLADFQADPAFYGELEKLGISRSDILAIVRPHAPEALYHRKVENRLLDELLDRLAAYPNVKIILLPRKDYQGREIKERHPQENIINPPGVLDGPNLIAAADLVVSGGGTMIREAAALGVPAYTVFAGKSAAVDEYLLAEGRLKRLSAPNDLNLVLPVKKPFAKPRQHKELLRQIVDRIRALIEGGER